MTAAAQEPNKILGVDVGGTHVKVRVTGQLEERRIPSGSGMTATRMVRDVKRLVDSISARHSGVPSRLSMTLPCRRSEATKVAGCCFWVSAPGSGRP
jgi:hypothetical protein